MLVWMVGLDFIGVLWRISAMNPRPNNVDRWPHMTMSLDHKLNAWRMDLMVMTEGESRPRKS